MDPRAGLVAAAALATVAAAVSVQLVTYGGLVGEIVDIESSLAVAPGGVAINVLGLAASGTTVGTAVELAVVLATATPGVTAGNYAYTAIVKEASADGVTTGTYRGELLVDDVSKGQVFFVQGTSDLLGIEGVTLVWDIGASVPVGAAAYEVTVTLV